jgi:phosphonate transport system substrate-binding protein
LQASDANRYSFGIVPQQSATKLAKTWSPLFRYIFDKTNILLEFRTEKNIEVFEQVLFRQGYDFSYMNPYHYVFFHQHSGYQVFLKRRNKPIKGIFVVKKDESIGSLKDFHQQALAFPSPAAFAASILTRAELRLKKIDFTPHYVSSHDSVYRSVAKGLYHGGGGVLRTFNKVDPKIRSQLKVFWVSKGYTPHAWAAHNRVPDAIVTDLATVLQNLHSHAEGQKLLETIGIQTGLTVADNKDYDDIRTLKLDSLERTFGVH